MRKRRQVRRYARPASNPKVFKCLGCGQISMRLVKKEKKVRCGSCGDSYDVEIDSLTEPVDAYAQYVDSFHDESEPGDGKHIFSDPGFLEW